MLTTLTDLPIFVGSFDRGIIAEPGRFALRYAKTICGVSFREESDDDASGVDDETTIRQPRRFPQVRAAPLRFETRIAMQQFGAPSLKDITPDMVRAELSS